MVIFIAMRNGCHDLQGFVGKHQILIEFFIVKLNRVDCKFLLPSNFSLPAVCSVGSQLPLQVLTPGLVCTTFLGCVDFRRFYSCCYFHRCEMHSTKPRPQLLHRDAQGCTFCTELIGGLVVIPCTAILRIWTPFPALLFGLHCQFTPVPLKPGCPLYYTDKEVPLSLWSSSQAADHSWCVPALSKGAFPSNIKSRRISHMCPHPCFLLKTSLRHLSE